MVSNARRKWNQAGSGGALCAPPRQSPFREVNPTSEMRGCWPHAACPLQLRSPTVPVTCQSSRAPDTTSRPVGTSVGVWVAHLGGGSSPSLLRGWQCTRCVSHLRGAQGRRTMCEWGSRQSVAIPQQASPDLSAGVNESPFANRWTLHASGRHIAVAYGCAAPAKGPLVVGLMGGSRSSSHTHPRFDTSLVPFKTHLYGSRKNPVRPFRISKDLCEISAPAQTFGPLRVPYGGGSYFRLYPWWPTRAIDHHNALELP